MTPTVRSVAEDEWEVVAWLWQAFRHDLAEIVGGLPYADGRYAHSALSQYPGEGRFGYLAWTRHPKTGEEAPVAFALVRVEARMSFEGFWVAPAARRSGVGYQLALHVIGRLSGAWEIAFQHDNSAAGAFWRRVAGAAWGDAWEETVEPVPGKPDVPPDHWVRTH